MSCAAVPPQISVRAVETRSHTDKRLAISARATQSVKSVHTAVIRYLLHKISIAVRATCMVLVLDRYANRPGRRGSKRKLLPTPSARQESSALRRLLGDSFPAPELSDST